MMTATAFFAVDAPRPVLSMPLNSENTSKWMPKNALDADSAQMHVRSTL